MSRVRILVSRVRILLSRVWIFDVPGLKLCVPVLNLGVPGPDFGIPGPDLGVPAPVLQGEAGSERPGCGPAVGCGMLRVSPAGAAPGALGAAALAAQGQYLALASEQRCHPQGRPLSVSPPPFPLSGSVVPKLPHPAEETPYGGGDGGKGKP